jgi:hypothetical protein
LSCIWNYCSISPIRKVALQTARVQTPLGVIVIHSGHGYDPGCSGYSTGIFIRTFAARTYVGTCMHFLLHCGSPFERSQASVIRGFLISRSSQHILLFLSFCSAQLCSNQIIYFSQYSQIFKAVKD